MSLYAEYVKERQGLETLENEHGFFTYKIQAPECYIVDIFIKKESRRTGIATEMAKEIARKAVSEGCTYLTGTCFPSTHGATESMKGMFHFGFKVHSCTEDKIILIKEL